jgi:hypothetical protein
MPVNVLIVRRLLNLHGLHGNGFTVDCPTGSGNRMTLFDVAKEFTRRRATTFLRDGSGKRPVYGGTVKFQEDPHWRPLILFYEYFHGDNGVGLGASPRPAGPARSPRSWTSSAGWAGTTS